MIVLILRCSYNPWE